MKNKFCILLACCFIFLGCQNTVESPKECILENVAEADFFRLEEFGIIHSVLEEEDETIILSYYPEVKLTGIENESFNPIWVNDYAAHTTARGNDVLRKENGNFAIAGEKYSRNSWILECNEWEKDIHEYEDNFNIKSSINAIIEIEDGNIISAGKIHPDGGIPNQHIRISKLESDGTEVWQKTIERSNFDSGLDILKLNNNNVLICYEWRENALGSSIGFIEITTDGDIVREEKIEDFKELFATYIKFIKSSDDGLLVGASQSANITHDYSPLVIKLNQNLEVEWSSVKGTTEDNQYVEGIKELSNGDILVFGSSHDQCVEGLNMYIARLNSEGNLMWQKTYGDNFWSTAKHIVERENGDLFILGDIQVEDISPRTIDILIFKIDQEGNPI